MAPAPSVQTTPACVGSPPSAASLSVTLTPPPAAPPTMQPSRAITLTEVLPPATIFATCITKRWLATIQSGRFDENFSNEGRAHELGRELRVSGSARARSRERRGTAANRA